MKRVMRAACTTLAILLLLICLTPGAALASRLSYTFMDFQALNSNVSATGEQSPVLGQTVSVTAGSGDGIAVGGSLALRERVYFMGSFRSSVIDVDGLVQSPFTEVPVSGRFDLVLSTIGFGYKYEIGQNLDVIAELTYDSIDYDFGSFAGERFDVNDRGAGARLGFRWNPVRTFELFAAARHSSVAKAALSDLSIERDTTLNAGIRWYFFEDLGVGLGYESGDIETVTLSLRFSFGNLPW